MTYVPYATSYIWQNIQEHAKHVLPGHMYLFWYNNWQHDMTPLALIMKFEKQYDTFQAINFHYIDPEIRISLLNSFTKLGLVNEDNNSIQVDYNLIKEYVDDASIFLRRYKVHAIRGPLAIPVNDFKNKYWRSYGHIRNVIRTVIWQKSKEQFAIGSKGLL